MKYFVHFLNFDEFCKNLDFKSYKNYRTHVISIFFKWYYKYLIRNLYSFFKFFDTMNLISLLLINIYFILLKKMYTISRTFLITKTILKRIQIFLKCYDVHIENDNLNIWWMPYIMMIHFTHICTKLLFFELYQKSKLFVKNLQQRKCLKIEKKFIVIKSIHSSIGLESRIY